MARELNKAIVCRWSADLWSSGHLYVADELVAAEYVGHDPGDPTPVVGPAGVKRLVTTVRTALPDLRITVDDVIAEGDRAVCRYTTCGTDTGGYLGRRPTGKATCVTAIGIFRIRNGQIVESWVNRDDLGLLQQLAILPLGAA